MKSRLTITLSEDVLEKIDALIDKKSIRNRSHAIEHLIAQSLTPQPKTAIILAGGPEKEAYSPLTVVGSKPLILYTIDLLQKHGVRKVHIAINDQGLELKKLLGNGSEYGLYIKYHHEKKTLGTAGAVANILQSSAQDFNTSDYVVIAGDVLTTINLDELSAFHKETKGFVTMAVKPRPAQKNYDNVFMQGHTVVDFKASEKHEIVGIVNAGVYIFSPKINNLLQNQKIPTMLETDIFPKLSQTKQLHAFSFQGIWYDISSDQGYQTVVDALG